MRYEEPEFKILKMNLEQIICESPWIEDGTDIVVPGSGSGGDSGSYGN